MQTSTSMQALGQWKFKKSNDIDKQPKLLGCNYRPKWAKGIDMINAQNFQVSYNEALQAFDKAGSGSAFGKWVLSQVGSTSGFWGGADYDFFFCLRDLVSICKQHGKRPSKPLVFWVNQNGRGCLTMGSMTLGDK